MNKTYILGMLYGELEGTLSELEGAIEAEEASGDAMDSINRAHLEGYQAAIELAIKTVQEAN